MLKTDILWWSRSKAGPFDLLHVTPLSPVVEVL